MRPNFANLAPELSPFTGSRLTGSAGSVQLRDMISEEQRNELRSGGRSHFGRKTKSSEAARKEIQDLVCKALRARNL